MSKKIKNTSKINIKSFYGQSDNGPGEFPFKSGIYPNMYRDQLWTMRQYSGFASCEESNKRYKYLLSKDADPFRYDNAANDFLDIILLILRNN